MMTILVSIAIGFVIGLITGVILVGDEEDDEDEPL